MARVSNSDILNKYRSKIEQSERWRKQEQYDELWTRMVDLYRGKHYSSESEEDRLLVNIAFATINVVGPSVSINYPKISVNARKFEDADRAVLTETIVNYWWKHYDCQTQFRSAVKDFLIVGHGWLKSGYRFVEEETETSAVPTFDSFDELAETTPESVAESELIIKEDRPFIERISPHDIFVDPDATQMGHIKWIAQRNKRLLMDVKKDKRYNVSARNDAQPSHYSKYGMDADRPKHAMDEDNSYVEVWEFYDVDRDTMSIFCNGSDKFLVNPVKIPFAFGHPFIMLRNYDIPEHFYPMGELEAIEPLQMELNQTRTQMMNHRKRFSRKWLYKESAFDADGRSALESDEDNVMVPVISDENINSVVGPMPAIISPPEFYNQSELISSDIDRVSGVSEYMRGALPEIRRTATEAGIIQDNANARASEKLAIIERGIAECARRLIMVAQQYLTGEQAVRVAGSEAEPMWLEFDRDYIQGEFDFEVEGGSTAPVNESFKRQMAIQVVEAMAPFASAGIIDMAKLAAYVLQNGFGIRSSASFIIQPQMPAQQITPQGIPEPVDGEVPQEGMPQEGMPQDGQDIPPEIMQALMAESQGGGGMPPEM
jgi:hypothetical protein